MAKNLFVGVASAGAGAVFSFALFQEMGVQAVFKAGTVFSYAAFALVALMILITGYLVLPHTAESARRDRIFSILMVFFGVIVSVGVIQAFVSPPPAPPTSLPITVRFMPSLANVKGLDIELKAELDDGKLRAFTDEPETSNVTNGQRLFITVKNLDVLIRKYVEQLTLSNKCNLPEYRASCDLRADAGAAAGAEP